MVRTLVVSQATNLQAIGSTLLDARFSGTQADAAMERLKALNPHVDPKNVPAGTVLVVPDVPAFKASASSAAQTVPVEDFSSMVSRALESAAADLKNDVEARSAERSDLNSVLKSAAVKRVVGDDKDLAQQVADAQKALATDEKDDKQAQQTLTSISQAARAALEQISKAVG